MYDCRVCHSILMLIICLNVIVITNAQVQDPCKADIILGDIGVDVKDYKALLSNRLRKTYRKNKGKTLNGTFMEGKVRRHRRAATALRERLWEYGVIPYQIDANFSSQNKVLFKQAMKHWENYTCITFKEKEQEDTNFLYFTRSPCGCCSFVGKKGNGGQAVSIGDNCDTFGIVVHELGHAIGFWHEHTRPDRDRHVQIISKNVIPGQEYNFNKLTSQDVNSLGETYDFGSIMHYSKNTFAINPKLDTLLPIVTVGTARPEIGQRVRLSDIDIRQTNKLYACPTCGRTFQEIKNNFFHIPKKGSQEICQWRISAALGERIVVNITNLNLPTSYDCRSDFLEVRDGHYLKSPLLGRFCGAQQIKTLISSGPRLWMEYRTERGGGNGFSASYEAICGGEMNKDEGFIASPNYPDHYIPQRRCVWYITVPADFNVALKFQTFEVENHDNCEFDYLEIRDGPSELSPLIGNFCGYKIPNDIKSTGHQLFVKFVSDVSIQKSGFSAMFVKEYDECNVDDHGCDHECVNTFGSYKCTCRKGYDLHSDGKRCEDACGGYLDVENGTISSPSYPNLYPSNKNCIWKIAAPLGYKIFFNFTHFDLEGHQPNCQYDSVRVSSPGHGDTEDLKVFGVYCGDIFPKPITSENNTLKIEFNTDNSVQKTGFTATFFSDKDECSINNAGCHHICRNIIGGYVCDCSIGFNLNDDMHTCGEADCFYETKKNYGVITSPNYPEYYPSRSDCVWHFITAPGHRIKLQFRAFELEPHQKCSYDNVQIYDGNSSSALHLAKFCGPTIPKPVLSHSNHLYLTFSSDASVQRKGFQAEHFAVCGSSLVASETPQLIVSHALFGEQSYDNNETCEWQIQAQEGQYVELRFTFLDVEEDAECGYDNVTIYSGLQHSSSVMKIFCGSEIPTPMMLSSRSVLLRFSTDGAVTWKGFSLTYQAVIPSTDEDKNS